eukprot:TRINITY_DN1219_c0_g1_i1.p1 TRINITY_DN1219_c0_g1~~TRINITY_DN1219_c0_g1_i1.p1  ORF type:complete len:115 (+),score=7.07 TRINITY_DN1219_c0_g1_i1:281-625(+)
MAMPMSRWFQWLHMEGHIDETKSRELQGLAKQKETDLPRGEQASQLLFQESRRAELQEPIVDSVDGYFVVISRSTESCWTVVSNGRPCGLLISTPIEGLEHDKTKVHAVGCLDS